ncbi:MAG: hypothetical protein NVS9B1_23700 [Candidatus Dormibacteraceae bacterium]
MDKPTKRDLEKTIQAKAKGKQPRKKVVTETAKPGEAEVDTRISKAADLWKFNS